ncbi:Zinc finger, SWIM-type [Plasmopara halstedii]|uniref:Zinc finger, SWIM-type n=1 Tax=Plasmopara halstedii TaxID=4781 RepID=A0A0P1B800_PLAHL|nr:Zinc finger, SWIM-type [Plasmopara halstedii]CEG50362.1 Zinc finger, SWIM-type [Plasmopara halstedii]|eukprot:XP_024586731.1 Zinc finger, SWIM-type [Plasmopara halstedii]
MRPGKITECSHWFTVTLKACAMEMEELKQKRLTNGKEAVRAIKDVALAKGKCAIVINRGRTFRLLQCDSATIGCEWHVRLARFRSRNHQGDWHVTGGNLDHQNCVSLAKPLRIQLVNNPVVRGALAANPATSINALVAQLRHQKKVTASQHVMYRAKDFVMAELHDGDSLNIRLLPSLLAEFQRLNTGVLTEVHVTNAGDSDVRLFTTFPHGSPVALIVMVGRDGNLTNKIVAVALAPVEDYDNYLWFPSKILHHGFPLTACPVFSNRNSTCFASTHMDYFSIWYMRTDETVRLTVTQEQFVLEANTAVSHVAFEKLNAVNPAATIYLTDIPASKRTLHPHVNTTPLYGWRTTNFVESEQAKSLRLKPRKMQPYEFFKSYLTIFMGEAYNRFRLGQLWVNAERKPTPRAERNFQAQLGDTANYMVTFSSDDVAFTARISNSMKQRRVDLTSSTCSCLTQTQHRIACHHPIATPLECNMVESAYELMGECYTVASYQENLGTLEIPEDDLFTADLSISPDTKVSCKQVVQGNDASDPMTNGKVGGSANLQRQFCYN